MSEARFWSAGVLAATLGIAAMSLAACAGGGATSTGVRQVVSTTSFGMCVGYCTTRLEISEGQAVLVRMAHGGRGAQELPEQRFAAALAPGEWREIARLAANTQFNGLPPVIGCPDCADGGAESLTIADSEASRTISFDYNAPIVQAQPLLERVRALRERMTPKR